MNHADHYLKAVPEPDPERRKDLDFVELPELSPSVAFSVAALLRTDGYRVSMVRETEYPLYRLTIFGRNTNG